MSDIFKEYDIKNSDYDSENEGETVDSDTVDNDELSNLFHIEYDLVKSELVKPTKSYILHGANTKKNNKLSVGLSDKTIQIYNINNTGLIKLLNSNYSISNKMITGLKFENENMLYVSSLDGFVKLIDLRTLEVVAVFHSAEENLNTTVKPIISFDVNSNERILCCGTEKIKEDAFLIFFDLRQRTILGTYSESHIDDITTVKFHETNSDKLATGAADCLINIFDISKEGEDDALEFTFNTELSVCNINWHSTLNNIDILSCITHTNDLLLYNANNINLVKKYKRNLITKINKRNSINDCYLINCHNYRNNIMLLSGSLYSKFECLRSLFINENNTLKEMSNFKENEQIVRFSLFDEETSMIITGGEKGLINIWKEKNESYNIQDDGSHQNYVNKIKTHTRCNKKPY